MKTNLYPIVKKCTLFALVFIFPLFFIGGVLFPESSVALNAKPNLPSTRLHENTSSLKTPVSAPWQSIPNMVTLLLMTFFIAISLQGRKKRKKQNEKIVQFIQVMYDLQKPLELIRGPLDELSKDETIGETHKNKIQVALWSTATIQSTVSNLLEHEKLQTSLFSVLNSVARKSPHIKNAGDILMNPGESGNKTLSSLQAENSSENESAKDQAFMEKLMNILENNLEDIHFNIDTLSHAIGMSRSSLYNRIKNISGMAPADFIRIYRLERAKDLLLSHQHTISEVAYKTGFSDAKYFRAVFKKQYQMTPGAFSKKMQSM